MIQHTYFELFKRERWKNPFKIVLPISVRYSNQLEKFRIYDEAAKALIESKRSEINNHTHQIIINPIFHGRNFSVDNTCVLF